MEKRPDSSEPFVMDVESSDVIKFCISGNNDDHVETQLLIILASRRNSIP